MGKFSSLVPGRKKQTPQVTLTEPMSKAHRILGSPPLSIDARKNWDSLSSSGVSVNVAETSPSSNAGSSWSGREEPQRAARSQWGDESDTVPAHLRSGNLVGYDGDDATTDVSGMLRTRQSSSTIKSWYDKTTQPLSISQQTSSLAMAKGLPSKAQRMLDMDNNHTTTKNKNKKNKPSKLDLGLGRSRRSKTGLYDQYDNVMRSPSIMSPSTPGSSRQGRKLQKRPTQESIRSTEATDGYRPGTSDSAQGARGHHQSNNGLHTLYDHYEQMSLRQLMDFETHDDLSEKQAPRESPQLSQSAQMPSRSLPTHREEFEPTLEPTFDLLQTHPPRTAQTENSASAKSEKASSADYATSVSSRHTRTSRASRSIQGSDLHDKSVLLLSSDSEDDDDADIERPMRSPTASVSTRRASTISDDLAPIDGFYMVSGPLASSPREKRTSRTGKRTSFIPPRTYVNPPTGPLPRLPSIDSRGSVPYINPCNASVQTSRSSTISSSSVGTTTTWQNRPGLGVQEPRARAVLPPQGPTEAEESEHDTESETARAQTDTAVRDSLATTTDQPTPPMSPTSVDFYLRSGHSSIDGPGSSQNRIMAVSRQEELLLAALRQKRQVMRESPIAEADEHTLPATTKRESSRSHQSKPSEATITGTTFEFDFPAPPRANTLQEEAILPISITERRDSSDIETSPNHRTSSNASAILSPTPTRPPPRKGILKGPGQEPSEQPHERILLYLDRPVGPGVSPLDEPEPSPDLSDYVEYEEPPADGRRASANFAPAPRSRHSVNQRRISAVRMQPPSTYRAGSRQDLSRTARIAEEAEIDEDPASESEYSDDGRLSAGEVPRPDSPISPDSFPAVPPARMTLNKLARLSAVGPGTLGAEPGWWGDSD